MSTPPLILAIDTSCDDTSAAVTAGVTVWSNVIASQTQLHQPYGGVFPTVAKQAHRENIDRTLQVALARARVDWSQIQALAVTQGPGLAPSLEVGIAKAKELATAHHLPLVAVNHIEAHALSALAERRGRGQTSFTSWAEVIIRHQFPALAVVVSGGHTEFIKITQIGEYQRLGWTIDDAAGEALDKIGRLLDLGYPAGPIIEEFARRGDERAYQLPLPMTDHSDFNMSFSGLKTWARNKIEQIETEFGLNQATIYDLAASVQYGVFRHICYKLNKLISVEKINEVWLGGGVAANIRLRRMIRETLSTHTHRQQRPKIPLLVPYDRRLCMDNAAMIGMVAGQKFLNNQLVTNFDQFQRRPRWRVGQS